MKNLIRSFVRSNRSASRWLKTRYPAFFEPPNSIAELERQLSEAISARKSPRILECGGIDRPLLEKSASYRYDGLDIESQPGCEEVYDSFFVQSVEDELPGQYDLIISKTLIEHVPDNHKMWSSVFRGLARGGETLHYFPCKNHPYSLATRLVGNRLQRALIRLFRPEHRDVTGYPTYFHLCTPRATARELERQGFAEIRIRCYWDADDYFSFFLPGFVLISLFNQLCRKLHWSVFASGILVRAKK